MREGVTLIRWNEAMELLRQVKDDLVMDQLLNYANYVVLKRFQSQEPEELPKADFDLYFYLKTVKEVCTDRECLRVVLHGRLPAFKQMEGMVQSINLVEYCRDHLPDDFGFYEKLDALLKTSQRSRPERPFQPYPDNRADKEKARLLNWREAMLALNDQLKQSGLYLLPVNMLMFSSVYIVLRRLHEGDEPPAADFDLYFFVRAMQEFFSDHSFLSKILAGEDLRWFSDIDAPTEIHR